MSTLSQRSLDEVNRVLQDLPVEPVTYPRPRIMVGSGEDCSIVLFGNNYKRLHGDDNSDYE